MRRYASLRGRREFALVLRRGKAVTVNGLNVFALAHAKADSPARVGIVVKKQVGNAVERNLLRRRCKAILDQHPMDGERYWFVIQCKPGAAQISFAALRAELLRALAASKARASRASLPLKKPQR
jgi:ribonuclease P protein component